MGKSEKRKIQEAVESKNAIKKLVADRDIGKINEFLRKYEINPLILANAVYEEHKSFNFFNELNMSPEQLIFIVEYAFQNDQLVRLFLAEVSNIDFNFLLDRAINFSQHKTGRVIEIAIAAKNSGKGPSILLLTDRIIEASNAKYILAFLKVVTGIEGARIDDLINAFIKETKAIKNGIIEKYDWTRITDVVETINEFVNWAINQKDISLNEISQKVIATNKPEYIFVFLKALIGIEEAPIAPIDDLIQALINIGNAKYVYPLIKEHKKLSQENLYKLFEFFIEKVKKAFAPFTIDMEMTLAITTMQGIFDNDSLVLFVNYLNKSGYETSSDGIPVLLEHDFSYSVSLEEWQALQEQIANNDGGRQYQLVKPDRDNQV